MPTIGQLLGASAGRVNAGMIRQTGQVVSIELVGFRVARWHLETVARMIPDLTQQIIGTLQIDLTNIAKELARDNKDTGATLASIGASGPGGVATEQPTLIQFDGNDIWGDVGSGGDTTEGPADPQARLQEFGFIHTTGEFISNPYMVPALDQVTPSFINGMTAVGKAAMGFGPGAPPTLLQVMGKYRTGLYSLSKAMGDVQVFGVGFSGRGTILKAARALGDMNAVMRGGIASLGRIELRALGATATGFGRPSLSPGAGYSNASNRIYNRFAGKGFGLSIRSLSVMR